jgi:hypothetical protein
VSKLIQLVYISRSNLAALSNNHNIHPQVSQILGKSRRNNRAKKIVGALYFGNGYFFQCLEGEESDLLALYETIHADTRHTDLHIVSMKPITQRSFGNWEMKYVPAEQEIQKLVNSFGMTEFDPYRFDENMNKQMLQLLVNGANFAQQDVSPEQAPDTDQAKSCTCTNWKIVSAILAALLCADLLRQFWH